MPNDLMAQRNLFNWRAGLRSESRRGLVSSSFTVSIWTLSGVVLVACGNFEEFLGIDDDGGGGGRSVHVQKSPVQGARIYFDVNEDGAVSAEEMAAQDALYPEGFISDETGRVPGIPANFYGKKFEAHLDGAFDAETGEALSDDIYESIPDANGQHTLASPITDFIAKQTGATEAVIMGILDPNANGEADIAEFREQILDPASYLESGSLVEALAVYLVKEEEAGRTTSEAEVQGEIMRHLPETTPADTLEILNTDTDTTTPIVELDGVMISPHIGPHNVYVATVEAVNSASASVARYSFVEPDGNGGYTPVSSDVFAINARGVISVIDGATLTTTTLYVAVTNDAETEYARVVVTVADAASTPELTAPATTTATVAENTMDEDLIMGIGASGASVDEWVVRAPGDLSSKFDVVPDGSNHKLVLKPNAELDYEAIPNGVLDLEVWGKTSDGVRSNTLKFTIMVTDANDAPVFLVATEDNGLTDGTETIAENAGVGAEVARVRAVDADTSGVNSVVSGYAITAGNTGNVFDIDDNGVITLVGALDYEAATRYTLTITASDGAGATATQNITISVMDINDVIPTYTESGASDASVRIVTAAENTAGASTGYSITITDADTTNRFSVSVSGDARDRFEFQDQGAGVWELFLKTGEVVDEAEGAEIRLTYSVSDGDNMAAMPGSVSLNVIDTPISFTPPTEAALMADENDTGWMLQLEAESDAGGSGGMSPIARYEFVDGSSTSQESGIFRISDTGLITITRAFDFETDATSYEFTVRATDSRDDPESNEITFTISVQNQEEGDAEFALSGTVEAGETLTVTQTTADPDGIASISYAWYWEDATVTDPFGEGRYKRLLDENGNPHTGATYTIPAGQDLTNILGYEVSIEYTDNAGEVRSEAGENSKSAYLAKSSVRFTTPPPATIDVSEADSVNFATLGINSDGVLATVTAESSESQAVSYALAVVDDEGNTVTGLFDIDPSTGAISLLSNVDYETAAQYTLTITASALKEAGSTEMDTDTARIIFNVGNNQDGPAEYAVTENDAGTMLTVALVFGDPDIIEGSDPTDLRYQWYTTSDGGTTKSDITGITDTTSATLNIDGYTPPSGAIIGVTVSYQDPLNVADGTRTEIDVLASPIEFTQSSYTGTINEDGTVVGTLPTVAASVAGAPMASTITYAFLVDADTGITIGSRLGFKINADSGAITVSSTIPDTDFNYDFDPVRDSITLTVRATYDEDGAGSTEAIYRDVEVVIAVNDLNDETPEFAPLQVDTTTGAMAGLGVAELPGATNEGDTLTGTSAAEYINGGAGADTISSGGGNDHILGGAGDDEITLSTTEGVVETIYYRFTRTDSGAWVGVDGKDTIINFRRGEDRLVFLDDGGSVIDLETFIDHDNLAIIARLQQTSLAGVFIEFGANEVLEIRYHSSSYEVVFSSSANAWVHETANRYLGAIDVGDVGSGTPAGYDDNTGRVETTTLLPNYFNAESGDDNLQIADDALATRIVPHVLIPETFTSADGAFATVSATDGDGSEEHRQISYSITGGTGMGIFELDPTDNTLSLVSGMTLDYETTTEYTLTIEATDGTNIGTQTITIGIIDVNDVAPDIVVSTGSVTLEDGTAAGTDTGIRVVITDDARGDDFLITYKDLATGLDITGFELRQVSGGQVSGTTYGLFTTAEFDFDALDEVTIGRGGFSMLIGVSDIRDGTTDRTDEELASVTITATDINDNGPTLRLSSTTGTIAERASSNTDPIVATGITFTVIDLDATAPHNSATEDGPTPIFRIFNVPDGTPNTDFEIVKVPGGAANEYQIQHIGTTLDGADAATITLRVVVTEADPNTPSSRQYEFTLAVTNQDEGPGEYRVSGDLMVGETLTVEQVTADPDGIDGGVTYQWYKEAAGGTRTPLTADAGNPNQYTLKSGDDPATELFGAIVVYDDNAGIQYDETSNTIDVQANLAPEITGFTDADGMEHTTAPTISISTNMNRVQEVLASITATDRNTVDTLTYAFLVNGNPTLGTPGGLEAFDVTVSGMEVAALSDDGGFSIDPNTGRITFRGNLHPDAHDDSRLPLTLTVQVSDGTDTATANVKVNFLENTGTTTFVNAYTRGEADNFYVGSQLSLEADSNALDPDNTAAISIKYDYYRLVERTDPMTGETAIEEVGVLIQNPGASLDYTFTPEDVGHRILARATYTDSKGNKEVYEHTTATVVPAPAEASSAHAVVSEGAPDSAVLTYATLDGAENTNSDLTYAITSTIFRIVDASTGAIQLVAGENLDHETSDSHTLTVTVTDTSDSTTTTHDITIEVGDINDAPTATTSFAPGTTQVSVHRATTTTNTEDVSTGYRITLADEDGTDFNTMLTIMSTNSDFVFKPAGNPVNNIHELFLKAGVAISTQTDVTFSYSDGVNTVGGNVVVAIESGAPAKTPNRQAVAHDPYEPDDDPLAGITPMPDTNPDS